MARTEPLALVVEGFSDTAAGRDLGYYTVGRPAASGGIDQLKHLFRVNRVRRAAVIADNDEVGIAGAKLFCQHLQVPTCLICLPCKDLREFRLFGGDAVLLQNYIDSAIWKR
jgi:hypothetical protein